MNGVNHALINVILRYDVTRQREQVEGMHE